MPTIPGLYVEYKGKKIYCEPYEYGISLTIEPRDVGDITKLEGLADLESFNTLYLNASKISEIKGLENLVKLKEGSYFILIRLRIIKI